MNCKDIKENLIELSLSSDLADPAVTAHVKGCDACSRELESLRQTMALLDEWKAPEPSPYFLTRFHAHLREEKAKQPRGWLSWVRRPVLAVSLMATMTAGLLVYRVANQGEPLPPPKPGTAVGDLQNLERNQELYANFDLLDEIMDQPQQDTAE